MNRQILVVRNPRSGSARRWREAERRLREVCPHFEVVETGSPEAATELALKTQADLIVAAGGDGTIASLAPGLVHRDVILGILPLGTGNDLARHLGLNSVPAAVASIARATPRQIDAIAVEIDGSSPRISLNVSGFGFDAAVADRVNRWRGPRLGTLTYIAAVLAELIVYRPRRMVVSVDGAANELQAMLCSVANSSFYGGGMRVAPHACVEDGLLDVVLIRNVSRLEFLRSFPKVFSGTHLSHPAVTLRQGRIVEIDSHAAGPILIDGEVAYGRRVRLEAMAKAIKIASP